MQALFQNNPFSQTMPYNSGMPGGRPTTKQAPPFGKRLAFFRTQKGLSQSQFAKKLKISRELVGYYERRCTNPTADFVQNAAKVLDVSADELFGVTPPKAKPGPKPKLQQRLEQVKELPASKQKLVLDFLEAIIQPAK